MRHGFTLIELLVVVTIIVVLLALLTPALDKAIYAAEMAMCGANQHAVGASVLIYTMDFKKSYPYRAAVHDPDAGPFQADSMNYPFSTGNRNPSGYEDRTALIDRVNFKSLVCPMAGGIDLAPSEQSKNTWVFANYAMWWGWQYSTPGVGASGNRGTDPTGGRSKQPGMLKRGDRLSYTKTVGGKQTYRFRVLAADHNYNAASVNVMESTHPDSAGGLSLTVTQDGGDALFQAANGNPNIRITRSTWGGPYDFKGLLDLNYLFDDGSVKRYDRIDHTKAGQRGHPMVFVPNSPGGYDEQWLWQMLPVQ